MWAIVSELSDEDLAREYQSVILIYSPYLRLTSEQYQAIREYNSNEHKHFMRMNCYGDGYSSNEEVFLGFCHEFITDVSRDVDWSWLHNEIDKLSLIQKRRLKKRFYQQLNNVEIAKLEKVSSRAVDVSIKLALNKLKKLIVANHMSQM